MTSERQGLCFHVLNLILMCCRQHAPPILVSTWVRYNVSHEMRVASTKALKFNPWVFSANRIRCSRCPKELHIMRRWSAKHTAKFTILHCMYEHDLTVSSCRGTVRLVGTTHVILFWFSTCRITTVILTLYTLLCSRLTPCPYIHTPPSRQCCWHEGATVAAEIWRTSICSGLGQPHLFIGPSTSDAGQVTTNLPRVHRNQAAIRELVHATAKFMRFHWRQRPWWIRVTEKYHSVVHGPIWTNTFIWLI